MDNFEVHVHPDLNSGCWLWAGATSSNGYGAYYLGKRTIGAHRAAWIRANGEIPRGLFVCHKCDVKACCNPDHLFLGTAKENTTDMVGKGRHACCPKELHARGDKHRSVTSPETLVRGEDHYLAKVTEDDVRYIRSSGETGRALAMRFGVTDITISRIRRRLNWKHVQ